MKRLTSQHHILMMDIKQKLQDSGSPTEATNPKTLDLIEHGFLKEAAPRRREVKGGLNVVTFVVEIA